ncbi:peptidase [Afipia sp. Root123D2]|uniref:AprI/Inh family metalloprotease inhibitor n=1 Tax=Afipia sp. Root123D2 TaxID=1736436 RepID=UPI0006F29722|nr:AprI/Inh family metalloprotease inhibitor [Afipia sp. Root123D2]KQW19201.1 peptidase [Afipia sp. Root123D2]
MARAAPSSVINGLCSFGSVVACAAIAIVVAGWSQALAQSGTSLTENMVGQWEFSTAGRDKTCVVTLRGDAVRQDGKRLELEKGCGEVLPFMKSVASWSIKGLDIVRLQDAQGQPVIDMTEVESGIFEGLRPGEGVYLLQNLEAARALSKSADQMIGDWSMVRGNGNAICGLTLTNTDAGDGNFQVFLKPRCDAMVASFAPTLWRIERGEMLLQSAKGEVWRFEADDNAQWRRVPDSADPLIMMRQ